jgi:hypothetical protein
MISTKNPLKVRTGPQSEKNKLAGKCHGINGAAILLENTENITVIFMLDAPTG